jgi:hypothetical protein
LAEDAVTLLRFCARLDFAVDDPEGGKGLTVSEVSYPEAIPETQQLHAQWLEHALLLAHVLSSLARAFQGQVCYLRTSKAVHMPPVNRRGC